MNTIVVLAQHSKENGTGKRNVCVYVSSCHIGERLLIYWYIDILVYL